MPAQVTDAVAVGVAEAARVDLVDDGGLPPGVSRGRSSYGRCHGGNHTMARHREHRGDPTQRLTAMDAQFLYAEDVIPAAHAHTLKVSIYDPGPDAVHVRDGEGAAARPARTACRRSAGGWSPVPLDLHHPVWIEDPDFDLDWHVRRMAAPAPGGLELCELISEIASRPLDRTRPLWELWLDRGARG